MNPASKNRWAIAVAATVLLGLLFFGLKSDQRPSPPPRSQVAQESVPPAAPQATREATQIAGSDPSPKAAAQTPAVPNFVDLVQGVKPAVVSIRVKADVTPQVTTDDGRANPFEGTPLERFFRQFGDRGQDEGRTPQRHFYAEGQGSGFFISADGYVVTNNHVIANAVKVEVGMDDGKTLSAKVIGTDPKTDLALVKVEGGQANFPFVSFAEEPPRIGEWAIAMGNPFGLGGTVTAGIVSAQGRDIGSGPYNDFLQIDAAVNRGNSGGPTFNMSGRVIGVNTVIYSPTGGSIGIAFDIPASTVKPVVAQLKERGYVERGWIGVQVQPVTKEIADSLGMKDAADGALVSAIEPESPAAKAGLKSGDVVTSINGGAVKDSRDLARKIAGTTPNTSVKLDYLRDGKAHSARVTLGHLRDQPARKSPAPSMPDGQTKNLGIAVAPASRVMGIGEHGLAVLRVDPNGKAAEMGLAPGDVILKLGDKEMSSPQDLVSALDNAAKQNKQHVLALIRRNDREMFIALPTSAG